MYEALVDTKNIFATLLQEINLSLKWTCKYRKKNSFTVICTYTFPRRFLTVDDVEEHEQKAMETYSVLISYGIDQCYIGNQRYYKKPISSKIQ